jgi:hypothetical protein
VEVDAILVSPVVEYVVVAVAVPAPPANHTQHLFGTPYPHKKRQSQLEYHNNEPNNRTKAGVAHYTTPPLLDDLLLRCMLVFQ